MNKTQFTTLHVAEVQYSNWSADEPNGDWEKLLANANYVHSEECSFILYVKHRQTVDDYRLTYSPELCDLALEAHLHGYDYLLLYS